MINNKLVRYLILCVSISSVCVYSTDDNIILSVNFEEIVFVSFDKTMLSSTISTYPITDPVLIGETILHTNVNSQTNYELVIYDANMTDDEDKNIYLKQSDTTNRIQLAITPSRISNLINLQEGQLVSEYTAGTHTELIRPVVFYAVASTNNVERHGVYSAILVFQWQEVS